MKTQRGLIVMVTALALSLLALCVTSSAAFYQRATTPAQKDDRRVRAFVLEGFKAYTGFGDTREPVMVQRNGMTIELRPGDELKEGDRIYRGGRRRGKIDERGGGIAIYNRDNHPVAIIENAEEIDFTLSRMTYGPGRNAPHVEIINHAPVPPRVEVQPGEFENVAPEIKMRRPDGTPERLATDEEKKRMDNVLGTGVGAFGHRWDRAELIIEQGRKGAEKDYSQMEKDDWQQREERKRPTERERAAKPTPPPAVRPCSADEAAAFQQMAGSFHSYRMNITIGGSCEQATGTYRVAEWCEGVDETGNPTTPRVTGTFKGRIIGRSLTLEWDQPASPNHAASVGTGTCTSGGDGTFSCTFACKGTFKRQ